MNRLTHYVNENAQMDFNGVEVCGQIADRLAAYEDIGTIDTLTRLQRDYSDLRNELCLACGKCKEAHLGLCNNCRWYDSVDVNKMDCAAAAMEKGEGG